MIQLTPEARASKVPALALTCGLSKRSLSPALAGARGGA